MWVGCYTLDLYCDKSAEVYSPAEDTVHEWNEFPHQLTHESGSACRAIARKRGWIIKSNGNAICPKCSGKKLRINNKHTNIFKKINIR